MEIKQVRSRLGAAVLVLPLVLGIGSALNTSAQTKIPNERYAQERDRNNNGESTQRGRNWDRYGSYGGSVELRQTALNAGYNEGVIEGRRNRDNGQWANLGSQGNYQRATKGYNPRLGDRELYRRYFREAFEDGYNSERSAQSSNDRDRDRDGKANSDRRGRSRDGYGNFGGSFQLRQTALNAGFGEGTKQGRSDRSRRNGNGYQDRDTYKKATKDYNSGLGDREVYQRYFREAYEHGYADGYGGY